MTVSTPPPPGRMPGGCGGGRPASVAPSPSETWQRALFFPLTHDHGRGAAVVAEGERERHWHVAHGERRAGDQCEGSFRPVARLAVQRSRLQRNREDAAGRELIIA